MLVVASTGVTETLRFEICIRSPEEHRVMQRQLEFSVARRRCVKNAAAAQMRGFQAALHFCQPSSCFRVSVGAKKVCAIIGVISGETGLEPATPGPPD